MSAFKLKHVRKRTYFVCTKTQITDYQQITISTKPWHKFVKSIKIPLYKISSHDKKLSDHFFSQPSA